MVTDNVITQLDNVIVTLITMTTLAKLFVMQVYRALAWEDAIRREVVHVTMEVTS